MRDVIPIEALSDLDAQRLTTAPELSAGTYYDLVCGVAHALDIYNTIPDSTNNLVRTAVLKPIIGNYIHTMHKAFNLTHVLSILAPEWRADFLLFLADYTPTQLTRRVSSTHTELQAAYCLLNPYGREVSDLLRDTASTGNMQSEASIKNLRSTRREHVVPVKNTELGVTGKRDGKGKALPINPRGGRYLYESLAGMVMGTNLTLVMTSPLYLFHARAWGRQLWALELEARLNDPVIRCPYNNITVAQLNQGVLINPSLPSSIENGGWWYLVEAEDYFYRMGNKGKAANGVSLPFYHPIFKPGMPTTTAMERLDALDYVILNKVGLDGVYPNRNYVSALRSPQPAQTTTGMLKKIIMDEKTDFGFDPDPEISVREQMRVVPDYAVDLEEKVDSARLNSSHADIVADIVGSLDNSPLQLPKSLTHEEMFAHITAIHAEYGTPEEELAKVLPFPQSTPSDAEARIAEIKARIIEANERAAKLAADLEPN